MLADEGPRATREDLLAEVAALRARVAQLEAGEVGWRPQPVAPELVGREVSCRLLGVLFDAARARDVPADLLVAGTGCSAEHIRDPRARISWEAFARLMENAASVWTDDELEAIGGTMPDDRLLLGLRVLGRLLYSVTDFYLWVFGPSGPIFALVASEDGRATELEPGLLRLEVRMRPGYAPSRPNFVMATGALRGIASAFGYAPAVVERRLLADGAVYHVRVPVAGGRLAWVRRGLTWLFAARRAGAELRSANEALHARYLELQREMAARTAAEAARKELEAQREELLARMQLVLAAMPLGCLLHEADGGLAYRNAAAERILGGVAVPDGVLERLLHGESVPSEVVEADGRRIEWHHTPLTLPDGGSAGALSVCEDVTERERFAEQVLESQKMEGLGRLAGGIAHDFNNLLSVVIGHADLLERDLADDERAVRALEQIRHASERGAVLAGQLLAFSRQQVREPRLLDLSEIVASTVRMLAPILGEDVDLVLRTDPDLGAVRADAAQIEQILVNLVINARDAMPRGGRLTIETRNAGDDVELIVADDGVGMDAETMAHAFDPFFTTKPVGKGTGLGLASVYGIVKQSGGTVDVDSAPGRGATFRVTLPRAAGKPEVVAAPEVGEVRGGTEAVLLVEDDEALRTLACEVLEGLGYRVLDARHPDVALRIAAEEPVDLLLTDVVMPAMNGVELARRVAELRPEARVLFVSGYAGDDGADGLLDAGPVLAKPFTPASLGARVRAVLDEPGGGG